MGDKIDNSDISDGASTYLTLTIGDQSNRVGGYEAETLNESFRLIAEELETLLGDAVER